VERQLINKLESKPSRSAAGSGLFTTLARQNHHPCGEKTGTAIITNYNPYKSKNGKRKRFEA
jgi:hypothetical protein